MLTKQRGHTGAAGKQGGVTLRFWKAALICVALIASSCCLFEEKVGDVWVQPELASLDRTSTAHGAANDLMSYSSATDYYIRWFERERLEEVYYLLRTGPTFYSEWNAIIVAFPSGAADSSYLGREARSLTYQTSEAAKEYEYGIRLYRKQRLFVFFVDFELTQKLDAGTVIRTGEKERLTEKEFREQFPEGEEAAYSLYKQPDGKFLLTLQSEETGIEVDRAEAVEYVREHGPPWSYERAESADEETGETHVCYYVERESVNFEATDVPLVELVRENAAAIVAVAQFHKDGSYEFTDDTEKIFRLVGSTLKNEDEYHIDFF
ncbi:MAG: hypothetical protein A2Y63_03955 [Candidatus Riflebacteria bacterium RBG_13_59_9]|nr:MAG: hypothetical protein A2Y63_03955 [Candidatus Riflebacteria bacterium RBG_13_59_9]